MADRAATSRWALLFVAIGCFANLAPVTSGLHMDDFTNIAHARDAAWSLRELSLAFSHGGRESQDGYLPEGYERPVAFYFRPVVVALFKIEHALFGLWAPGYHLTNYALHLLVAVLLYAMGRRSGLEANPSLWAVALFLLHGPSLAACAWVSGRTEIVSALFVLLAMLAYARLRDGGSVPWILAVAILSAVAQGAKEQAVLLPVLAMAYDRFVHRDRRLTAWPLALVVPVLAVAVYRSSLPGLTSMPPASFYFHPPSEPGFLLHVVGRLLQSILSLLGLLSLSPIPYGRLVTAPVLAGLGAAVAAAGLLLRRPLGRAPAAVFLGLWCLIFMMPTLVCSQLPLYLYVPGAAACLLLGSLAKAEGPVAARPFVIRWRRTLLALWAMSGVVHAGIATWLLGVYASEQASLARAVVDAAPPGRTPFRVHLFGATLAFSGFRSHLRLLMPDRPVELHLMTLSPALLRKTPLQARWVTASGALPRLRVFSGPTHPYRNERYRNLQARSIAFDVGDAVATKDYTLRLAREGSDYVWEAIFPRGLGRGWRFFLLLPDGQRLIDPPGGSGPRGPAPPLPRSTGAPAARGDQASAPSPSRR